MKIFYSQLDRKILECLDNGPVLQRRVFDELRKTGTGEAYLYLRTRQMVAKGQIARERGEGGVVLTITPAGRHARAIMRMAAEAGL